MPPVFIPEIEHFPLGVADGVVCPGGNSKFMGVFSPGGPHAALRYDRAEERVRDDISPRGGSPLSGGGGYDVFPAVGGEAAETVEKGEILPGERGDCRRTGKGLPGGDKGWYGKLPGFSGRKLFLKGSPAVEEDDPRHGLDEDAVLLSDLVCRAQEDPSEGVGYVDLDIGGDEVENLVVEDLPVAAEILVPDDEVHSHPLEPPVGMGGDELPHEIDVRRVLYSE